MPRRNYPWYLVAVICFALLHTSVFVGFVFYCVKHGYEQTRLFHWVVEVLQFPVITLRVFHREYIAIFMLLNGLLWGFVLAEPIRWWLGGQFRLRTLLIAMTMFAILLGIQAWVR